MKTYIFDLYGTLIDIKTEYQSEKIWQELANIYTCYGALYTPQQLKKTYFAYYKQEWILEQEKHPGVCVEIRFQNIFAKILDNAPKHCTPSHTIKDKKRWLTMIELDFRALTRVYCKAYPHTHEVLNSLKQQGHPLILLSNAQRSFAYVEMGMCGLLQYFDHIYISSDYGTQKPEKSFMQRVLDEQHLNPKDCVMVGNEFKSDMLIAARCDVRGIYMNTAHDIKEEIEQRLKHLQQEYPNFDCHVVMSGDIAEITEL